MFTGIVTDVGRVRAVETNGDTRFEIDTAYPATRIAIGASIACSGPCLTVVKTGEGWFAVTASAETLRRTTLGEWRVGTPINLERSLRLGDELGGHLVSGHADGVGRVVSVTPEGDSLRMVMEAPAELSGFLVVKGAVAVDGVSLTINEVDGSRFGINIIPHTLSATTFSRLEAGARVNIEVDMLARYLARLMEERS